MTNFFEEKNIVIFYYWNCSGFKKKSKKNILSENGEKNGDFEATV